MSSGRKSRRRSSDRAGSRRQSPSDRTWARRGVSFSSSDCSITSNDTNTVPGGRNQRQGQLRSVSSSTSNSSGSSIETLVDRKDQRVRAAHRRGSANSVRLFTESEDRRMARSLRRKLLANDGEILNRIEGDLFRKRRRGDGGDGWVDKTAFVDALAQDGKYSGGGGRGGRVTRDETLWLSEKLESRNGRKVACCRIRSLLIGGEYGEVKYNMHALRKGKSEEKATNGAYGWRGKRQGTDRARRRTSFRDGRRTGKGRGDDSDNWESDEQGFDHRGRPAKWAVRQGTVGQWLQDVASPMENKLFFEFIRGLEDFEHRNGLDHYRVRPPSHDRGRANGADAGTTILHLGPMLKAAIRFYV